MRANAVDLSGELLWRLGFFFLIAQVGQYEGDGVV